MDFFATSDHILRLSMLTLVLRAAPQPAGAPTTFSPACIEAARATLHRHQDCLSIIEKSSQDLLPTYVHWYVTPGECSLKFRNINGIVTERNRTLLFAPFIPFIVVFCHVIETRDKEDIDRLGAFVTSIHPAAAASDAAAKLHRLFQVLHGVAARWVELPARYDDGGDQPQAATEERDAYLNLLCMPSVAEGGAAARQQHSGGLGHGHGEGIVQATVGGSKGAEVLHDGPAVMNPMMRMAHGAQLEEWFYSNQALMESFQTFSHGFEVEGDLEDGMAEADRD